VACVCVTVENSKKSIVFTITRPKQVHNTIEDQLILIACDVLGFVSLNVVKWRRFAGKIMCSPCIALWNGVVRFQWSLYRAW